MAWFILSQILSTVLTLLRLGCTSDKGKDLEILILRQQLMEKTSKPGTIEEGAFSNAPVGI